MENPYFYCNCVVLEHTVMASALIWPLAGASRSLDGWPCLQNQFDQMCVPDPRWSATML